MFIVKAIRPGSDETRHGDVYATFQCDYYTVFPSTKNGSGPPGQPYVPPQREVRLYERDQGGCPDANVGMLDLGVGDEHYCTIYIMNDRGKTIDTIQADLGRSDDVGKPYAAYRGF